MKSTDKNIMWHDIDQQIIIDCEGHWPAIAPVAVDLPDYNFKDIELWQHKYFYMRKLTNLSPSTVFHCPLLLCPLR
jgi:hypothetical protein